MLQGHIGPYLKEQFLPLLGVLLQPFLVQEAHMHGKSVPQTPLFRVSGYVQSASFVYKICRRKLDSTGGALHRL